jgi:hypothetical protein
MILYLPAILMFWSCALASKTYKYFPIYLGRYLHNRSSMDSFTLGLLPKIDFNNEHNNGLRACGSSQILSKIYSLGYKEFNTEFCKLYMLKDLF